MKSKYNHQEVEQNKNQKWIDKGYFSTRNFKKEPFSILLPPPNVTGKLHLGHAFDTYIQDSLIRYHKLQDKDVFWISGMDHAGIATQAKVEERLKKKNVTRHHIGREKFIEKVWEWKEEYASTIRVQWAKLGLALDYTKERFTMDPGLGKAVQEVFMKMHADGLIYRGKRAVSWDPELQTVLSNIEVENKEKKQTMFYIKYDLETKGHIEIATTRPETIFSDVAIAIHPDNPKTKHLLHKTAINPLTGLKLPIISDTYIKQDKGTGIMKVSAHAEQDIEIIQKHNMDIIECIDKHGIMNKNAMSLAGQNRFDARKNVVKLLKNRIIKQEETISLVGYSSRSGQIIEILVQPQWFVKMKPLAKLILDDLKQEGVKFFPSRFSQVLTHWMEEVNDWCISRQLWWGHQIPAWYKDGQIKVSATSPGEGWVQDEDVLDTWFSSGIAPFSFLGWPEKSDLLKRYYPSDTLVTGYDIIFFWVARMYFQSLYIKGSKPFKNVLIHGLIRAEDGQKMSKSLGNGIDPMDVVYHHGSDALRWFLLTNSTPGQDIRYSEQKIKAGWNLNNKLWNISRYILKMMDHQRNKINDADRWILNKLDLLDKFIDQKITTYEFTLIGKEILRFVQDDLSSWYIELSKSSANQKVAKYVLEKLMIILHPFLPFVTDEIYTMINGKELLAQVKTPVTTEGEADYINEVINVTLALREFRSSKNIANTVTLGYDYSKDLEDVAIDMINRLANATLEVNQDAKVPLGKEMLFIKLTYEMKQQEAARIAKLKAHLESEIKRAQGMLANPNFVKKAPKDKIKIEEEKLAKLEQELAAIK